MKRGDIISVAAPGNYTGKPRPAVVVQNDFLNDIATGSVILCPLTTYESGAETFRIPVEPSAENGLHHPSQIMVEKVVTVPRSKVGKTIGHLDDETMIRLSRTLAFVIGLGQ